VKDDNHDGNDDSDGGGGLNNAIIDETARGTGSRKQTFLSVDEDDSTSLLPVHGHNQARGPINPAGTNQGMTRETAAETTGDENFGKTARQHVSSTISLCTSSPVSSPEKQSSLTMSEHE
jgi:hypothetical protein